MGPVDQEIDIHLLCIIMSIPLKSMEEHTCGQNTDTRWCILKLLIIQSVFRALSGFLLKTLYYYVLFLSQVSIVGYECNLQSIISLRSFTENVNFNFIILKIYPYLLFLYWVHFAFVFIVFDLPNISMKRNMVIVTNCFPCQKALFSISRLLVKLQR